jgi:hypothetical protein
MDLSIVYGTNTDDLSRLSDENTGKMLLNNEIGGTFPPIINFFGFDILDIGDGVRGNQQNALLSLHVLALREHNYWVDVFKSMYFSKNKNVQGYSMNSIKNMFKKNQAQLGLFYQAKKKMYKFAHPAAGGGGKKGGKSSTTGYGYEESFTPAQLFHLARRMTISIFQKITIEEWLPAMTGQPSAPYTGYDETCDPSAEVEIMGLALRIIHTMSRDHLKRLNAEVKPIQDELGGRLELQDTFFQPVQAFNTTAGIEAFILGSIATQAGKLDLPTIDGVKNSLLIPNIDLPATDIQRGRDMEICDYNIFRQDLGFSEITDWTQLNNNYKECQWLLLQNYVNISNIDAYIGTLCEDHLEGSTFGEIGQYLYTNIFQNNLQHCDRFYYKNPGIFNSIADVDEELILKAIKETSLTDMILRHSNGKITYKSLSNVLESMENGFILNKKVCRSVPL